MTAMILAPSTGLPDASVTVPWILPVCSKADAATKTKANARLSCASGRRPKLPENISSILQKVRPLVYIRSPEEPPDGRQVVRNGGIRQRRQKTAPVPLCAQTGIEDGE